MPNVVLGVTGSIAAYRAADLARDLMRAGYTVRVCLTEAAEKFVTKDLFEALTGQPALVGVFDEPVKGRMAHIDWARLADLLLIAPATADILAKLAYGVADDMLTTIALAYEGPILIAPAMNPSMYAQASTKEAMKTLEERGATFIEPAEGDVACGEQGQGKLAANSRIVEEALSLGNRSNSLTGKLVLITSGPTQEQLDDVRFLTNRSSGKMGAALAKAALLMGAEVSVITGPTSVPLPKKAIVQRVKTAQEMLCAAQEKIAAADIVIGAAAVSDYRPADSIKGKRRRSNEPWEVTLIPNPDVIAELAQSAKKGAKIIGFAAEPDPDVAKAKEKLTKKGLYAIAVNDISRSDIGFESDQNELTLIFNDGRTEKSGKKSKFACALWLLQQIGG
jgi:phosphopantothenoylcysteine decarboxylase/phosphopantothenate--cysteine ligase